MKKTISTQDISDFFDIEFEAQKKKWEATMALPIKDRIRKRKAIKDVQLVRDFNENTDIINTDLYKVNFKQNLSDFKVGEPLLLHKPNINAGIRCTLVRYEDENNIIIGVYRLGNSENIHEYYDRLLILDKDLVDIRSSVYDYFTSYLKYLEVNDKELLVNSVTDPTFNDLDIAEVQTEEAEKFLNIKLTENQREAVLRCISTDSYYLIQGPPGTGKSFLLAFIIFLEYITEHKVIIIGPTHLSINNTLEQVLKLAPFVSGNLLKVGDSYNSPKLKVEFKEKEHEIMHFPNINTYYLNNKYKRWIAGLTPHSLYSSKARNLECDVLIIDEAGQMTIPLATMGMIKAKRVIMAGDHKQLPPIITSDEIKECLTESVFKRMINENNHTMLNTSFRMCDTICRFVSELFYDGQVNAKNKEGSGLIHCEDKLYDFDTPIIIHDVQDEGKQTSDKEAEFISNTIAEFLNKGIEAKDIAVLTPFRAQAANVRRQLHGNENILEKDRDDIVADTIDSMQGQEREVIIFSLTSGDTEYMEEMKDFLYNPNKLNVAFSRAKSKLIIVGNITKIKGMNLCDLPHIEKMLNSDKVVYY